MLDRGCPHLRARIGHAPAAHPSSPSSAASVPDGAADTWDAPGRAAVGPVRRETDPHG